MDPIAIAFYAIICGVLGVLAPNLGGTLPRLAIGAVVGVMAALIFPALRGLLGI